MNYQSKYFSNDVELPDVWSPEEFWWTVEQLEKLENDNLFYFCLELGVLEGKTPKGSVMPEEMIKKILYEGNKNRILDVLNKIGGFVSKYFSINYSPIPAGWTQKEFWWAVEQLEIHGDKDNLFELASKLGIKYDEIYRGKVNIDELISVIVSEGSPKEKVIGSIKDFCNHNENVQN